MKKGRPKGSKNRNGRRYVCGGINRHGERCSAPVEKKGDRCTWHPAEREDPGTGLTHLMQQFVIEYCADFNASRAVRVAGSTAKNAGQAGYEMMKNPDVRAAISQRLETVSAVPGEITKKMTAWLRGEMKHFLRPDGTIDLTSKEAQKHLYLLKKVTQTETTLVGGAKSVRTMIELHDPQWAADKLAKAHGMYTEAGDVNVTVEMKSLSDDEIRKRLMDTRAELFGASKN